MRMVAWFHMYTGVGILNIWHLTIVLLFQYESGNQFLLFDLCFRPPSLCADLMCERMAGFLRKGLGGRFGVDCFGQVGVWIG